MSWLNRMLNKPKETVKPTIVAGRQTAKADWGMSALGNTIPRPPLRSENLAEKLRVIRDINPDASLAIWNVLRLGISDYELKIITGQTAEGKDVEDNALTEEFNEWMKNNIAKEYGKGLGAFMNTTMLTLMTEGAVAVEVEMAEDLKEIIDWHLVKPSKVSCRHIGKDEDKPEGTLVYCWTDAAGKQVDLNEEQFRYIPIDPEIEDPFGRSPIMPVLMQVDFQIQLLSDLQAVVHNQGHPRIDVSVLEEAILEAAPENLKYDSEGGLEAFMEQQITGLAAKYADLKPDDAFIHYDNLKVNSWTPGTGIDFGKIENILTSQIVAGLKQLPILLGRNEGVTETHGTVQYRIYVHGVESMRKTVGELVEFCANLTLRIWGHQAKAVLEYKPIRYTDRQKEAQADKTEHETIQIAVDEGWIDDNEAANILYGHDASGDKQPKEQKVVIQGPEEEKPSKKEDDSDEEEKQEPISRIHDRESALNASTTAWMKNVKSKELRRDLVEQTDQLQDELVIYFAEQAEAYADRIEELGETRQLAGSEDWVIEHVLYDNRRWNTKLGGVMGPHHTYVIGKAGQEAFDLLKYDASFNALDPRAMAYLNSKPTTFAGIQRTTTKAITDIVRRDFRDGVHPYVTARNIRRDPGVVDMGVKRAQKIARTEMLDASNFGAFEAYEQSGMVESVEWVATFDKRTCPICQAAHGDGPLPLGDIFSSGFARPPAHSLCRCTLVPYALKPFRGTKAIEPKEKRPFRILDKNAAPKLKADQGFPFNNQPNPAYTCTDSEGAKWISRIIDNRHGTAGNDYNAHLIDRTFGFNRVPETVAVEPSVMSSSGLYYPPFPKEVMTEIARSVSTATRTKVPVFQRWLPDKFPVFHLSRFPTPTTADTRLGARAPNWLRIDEAAMRIFDRLILNNARSLSDVMAGAEQLTLMNHSAAFAEITLDPNAIMPQLFALEKEVKVAVKLCRELNMGDDLIRTLITIGNATDDELKALARGMISTEGFSSKYGRYLIDARSRIRDVLKETKIATY